MARLPGPLLRLKENQPITIEVTNRTDRPEVVHWHGLRIPADVDGATEEGTPAHRSKLEALATASTPRPAGFRWYHTHTMAMSDLRQAQYGGQHGFFDDRAARRPPHVTIRSSSSPCMTGTATCSAATTAR